MPNFKMPKHRAPIIEYSEIIPQSLWQRITRQEPRYRVRVKRAEPHNFNCRCSFEKVI